MASDEQTTPLWCLRVPGAKAPLAAVSHSAARELAARHNDAVARWLERNPGEAAPPPAAVEPWLGTPEAHAEMISRQVADV